jgi:hypothetical protein
MNTGCGACGTCTINHSEKLMFRNQQWVGNDLIWSGVHSRPSYPILHMHSMKMSLDGLFEHTTYKTTGLIKGILHAKITLKQSYDI